MARKPALARWLLLGTALAVVASGCGGGSAGATVPATAPPSVRVPDFTHVVLVFENHEVDSIVGSPAAPTFNAHVVSLLHSPELRSGVVFAVFDEGTSGEGGGGRIDALGLGPVVRRGSGFSTATNHYGLLRTIEDAWRLPRLGYSRKGTPIGGIWK